jgi:hypothetical protein
VVGHVAEPTLLCVKTKGVCMTADVSENVSWVASVKVEREAITLFVLLIKKFLLCFSQLSIWSCSVWTTIKYSYCVNKSIKKTYRAQIIQSVDIKVSCDHRTQYSRSGVHVLAEVRSVRAYTSSKMKLMFYLVDNCGKELADCLNKASI